MPALFAVSVLALSIDPPAWHSRRNLLGGLLAGSVSLHVPCCVPPAAAISVDPIGAYSKMIPDNRPTGPVAANPAKPNSGIMLLREAFDGGLPAGGLLDWYQQHLAEDFTAEFSGGVTLDKTAYLDATAALLKSFPDFVYTKVGPIAYADSPTIVSWTAVVKGTHTGAPYSPLAGVPPVSPQTPPVVCVNDPEKVTAIFAAGTKLSVIKKLKVNAVPGNRGFSGPVGFYLQAGGDPSKLPSGGAR